MHPFSSYTEIKVVHDQDIKEIIDRQNAYTEQDEQKQGLLQMFGTFLARFNNHPVESRLDCQEVCG